MGHYRHLQYVSNVNVGALFDDKDRITWRHNSKELAEMQLAIVKKKSMTFLSLSDNLV